MPAEQSIIFIPTIDSRTVISKQPQVLITYFVMSQMLQQMFQRKNLLSRTRIYNRMRNNLLVLCYAYSINDVIAFLGIGIRCNLSKLIIADHTATTPLHLCVQHIRTYILHEEHYLQGLHICTGRHQCNCDSNSEILFCSQISDQPVGISG